MKEVGCSGPRVDGLVKQANQILTKIKPAVDATITKIKDLFPDAPVASDVCVPIGWTVAPGGLSRVGVDEPGLSAPVIITERCRDIHRGTEWVKLAWLRDGIWQTQIVERKVVADARRIIELAGHGLPVTSNNSKSLVQYLDDFEAQNLDRLPTAAVSHKMGWQGKDGNNGFLWGRTLITDNENADVSAPAANTIKLIRFRGRDEGDDQLADGFRSAGQFDAWVEAVEPLKDFPRALLALYTGFVPVMLPILRASNFVIDFSGATTSGKTTCLRVAASVWGNPDERSQAAALSTWNGTATWRERSPAVLNHLPFIMDETKHVRHGNEVAKTIYAVVQGRGRGRGTLTGIAEQEHCQTVLMSSGEQPAVSFTNDGGTRPRVLTLWGSPFGATNQEVGQIVTHVNQGCRDHYGHAGPRFVQFLLERRDKWGKSKDRYEEYVHHYEEMAGDNAVAGRMAGPFAAITFTSKLVHAALDLPWDWSDPIAPLWEELTQECSEADRAAAALRLVLSWANAHTKSFYRSDKTVTQPNDGWAGRWEITGIENFNEEDQYESWEWVGFLPHVLERLLRDQQFDPNPIIRTWKDRGWLKLDNEANGTQRCQYRTKVGPQLSRVYAITWAAAQAVTG
jgi:hypothetical protein